MGGRGAFIKSGMTGIAQEYREYSVVDYIGCFKVIQWDMGDNNHTPVYSNTPNTVYYSYSKERGQIERILFYKDHHLTCSIDMEKHGNPAHVHKWDISGTQVGRVAHSRKNTFGLSTTDMKYYNEAKKWNEEHR